MAFEAIHTVLSENPTLTDEQHAQSFKLYEGRLEQAAAARVQAIARGEHMRPELRNAEPAPENGLGQPAADGEAGPAIEGTAKPNPNYLVMLQLGPGQSSNSLRRIGEEEGTERGEYAWNWNKLGGGAALEKCRPRPLDLRQNTSPLQCLRRQHQASCTESQGPAEHP